MSHFGVKTRLTVHFDMYSESCMDVKTAVSNSKSEILQKKISDCNGDQKKLFKIVDTLLGRNKHTTLPKYYSPLTMASVMNNFFIDKIDNIRAEFPLLEANLPCYSFLSMDYIMPICTTTLYHFDRVTDPELLKIISGMNITTCSSDPLPTRLLMLFAFRDLWKEWGDSNFQIFFFHRTASSTTGGWSRWNI